MLSLKKTLTLFALILGLIPFSSSRAEDISIFFSAQEKAEIYKQLERLPATIDADQDLVSLDAIIYKSPRNWTIWLNGMAWTPDNKSEMDFQLVSVSAKSIRVSLEGSSADPRVFTLKLNQKLNKKTGEILDAQSHPL